MEFKIDKCSNTCTEKTKNSSFLLKIKYQQNHSVQGTIQWIETRKTVCFRSLLELIFLIKEAAMNNMEIRSWDGNEGIIEEVITNRPACSNSRGGNP